MPSFTKGPGYREPFGRNQFLRSTQDVKTESYTFAKGAIPTEDVDGVARKVLQPGTVIAKITSGNDSGKVGVFDDAASDGRQTATNIVGLNNTFLPWQLEERDVEIAVVKECRAVQAWCFEYESGVRVALDDATAAELQNKKDLSILFIASLTEVR
jgi:hypothetical protein